MVAEQISNAIVLGSIFALFSLGLSLSWGALDVLNLAHGATFVCSAWAAGVAASTFGLSFLFVVAVGVLVGVIISTVLELVAFRPIRERFKNKRQSELSMVVATVGAGYVLESIVSKGTLNQVFFLPTSVFEITLYHFGGIAISNIQIIIVLVSVVAAVAMHVWIARSRRGMAIRAIAFSASIPSILGINVGRFAIVTMAISGALAGLAGVLLQILSSGMAVSTGHSYMLKAFAIVALGGVGSVFGCLCAAFLLAFAETAVATYGSGGYRDAIAFGVILLVLLLRPQGLFGRAKAVRA